MHNYNYICLKCLKNSKISKNCCGKPVFCVGPKARIPKKNGRKSDWKEFINLFVWAKHHTPADDILDIIKLREMYQLDVSDENKRFSKYQGFKHKIENILDVNMDETITISNAYNPNTFKKIKEFTQIQRTKSLTKTYKSGDKVWIVPIHVVNYTRYNFTSDISRYSVMKATALFSNEYNDFKYKISQNNKKFEITVAPSETTIFKINYCQSFLVFSTEIDAKLFRVKYLKMLVDEIEEFKQMNAYSKLIKSINADIDRIIKSSPELLI